MPRRFFHKLGRRREALSKRWFLRPFRALLNDPALWSSHRRSVLRALALGVFVGCLPLPFHMAIVAVIAVFLRVNLVVGVLATWISNPVTITPLFFAAYRLGTWLLGIPVEPFSVELSLEWLVGGLANVWKPLLTGSLVIGTIAAATVYLVMDAVWRISLIYRFRRRRGRNRSVRSRP